MADNEEVWKKFYKDEKMDGNKPNWNVLYGQKDSFHNGCKFQLQKTLKSGLFFQRKVTFTFTDISDCNYSLFAWIINQTCRLNYAYLNTKYSKLLSNKGIFNATI